MTEKNKEQAGTDEDQDHENQKRTHEPGEESSSKQPRLAPFEVSRSSATTLDREDENVEQPSTKAKEESHKRPRINRVEIVHFDVDVFEHFSLCETSPVFENKDVNDEVILGDDAVHDLQDQYLISDAMMMGQNRSSALTNSASSTI